MTIKEIIDAERWDRNVFDPGGKHNTASAHNTSLDRIEAGVSCVSEYVAELEAELEEYKGHFVDGLKECWYRGESIKALQENLDNANKRIAELEKTINQLSKADASLRAQNEAQERNAVASAKHIAELEAQLPKVVKTRSLSGDWQSTAIIP